MSGTMKRIALHVVVDVPEDEVNDADVKIADSLPEGWRAVYATKREARAGEDYEADDDDDDDPDSCTCHGVSLNRCSAISDLHRKQLACIDIFVANRNGTFTCGSCIPMTSIDIEDPKVEVWEVGSDGWTHEISCCMCSEAIDVEVMPEVALEYDADGDPYFVCRDEDYCGLVSWLVKKDRKRAKREEFPFDTQCAHCNAHHLITG